MIDELNRKYLYRYVDSRCGHLDEWDNLSYTTSHIYLKIYEITSITPCGYNIDMYGKRKWVSNSSKKRFAYPTTDEAWKSFKIRKERQRKILKEQLNHIENVLVLPQPK